MPRTASPNNTYTLTGKIVRIHVNGFGFIHTGAGNPDFFILRSQLPDEAWVRGTRLGFNPLPVAHGKRCAKVTDVVVLSIPKTVEKEEADAED